MKVARQLQHVVAAAAFLGGDAQFGGQIARIGAPAFAVACAAGGVTAFFGDLVPEVFRYFMVMGFAGQLIAASGPDHLRNMGVDVKSLELIAMGSERVKKGGLFKAARYPEVLEFACGGGQVEEHLFHSAELRQEDALHVRVADPRGP